ncbi:hypothetical protein [Streptomyces sp. NPDC056480]
MNGFGLHGLVRLAQAGLRGTVTGLGVAAAATVVAHAVARRPTPRF